MSKVIKPKRSFTADSVPTTSDLAEGEVAINTADKIVYVRDDSDNIVKVGGAQSPLNEDLDTNDFEIKSTKPNPTDFIGTPYVKLGSPTMLYKTSDPDALVTVDVADVEVGFVYKIKENDSSFDWTIMGCPTATPSVGATFNC